MNKNNDNLNIIDKIDATLDRIFEIIEKKEFTKPNWQHEKQESQKNQYNLKRGNNQG